MNDTSEQQLFELVAVITSEQLDLGARGLWPHDRFVADLGAEDMDPVELMMAFEKAFQIVISKAEGESIRCLDDVVQLVLKKRAGGC